MTWSDLRMFAARAAGIFRQGTMEERLEVELRTHLVLAAEENARRGLSPEEAQYAARREFGGVEQTKETYREQRGLPIFETLWNDARFGMRMLAKTPGFTAVAILTLAVGIGANTAIFSVVHAVLLAPFPYPAADRLAIVWSVYGKEGRAPAAGPELTYLRERSRTFEEFAGIWAQSGALTGEREPEQVKVGLVTSNFLSMLSAKPQLGRFFIPAEEGWGKPRVVILSDGLWRRRFGADLQLIGKSLRLNAQPFTVVGVMPSGFRIIFPEGSSVPPDMDAFIPFPADLATQPAEQGYIRVVGRLKRGATLEQAQSEAHQIAAELRSRYIEFSEQSMALHIVPLHGDVVRNLRPALLALFAGVGFVLLIACANVANLLLSRANQRQKEVTLRIAVGATRGRLIRQLLTESVLLSSIGGTAALWIGSWALKLLVTLRPQEMERLGAIGLDLTAFGFTLAMSVAAGILCGVMPALGATQVNLVASLKEGGRSIVARKSGSRSVLVVCEVALGFVLLIGAGLMIQTFAGLLRVDPGFAPANVLTFHVSAASEKYQTPEAATTFFCDLQKNLSTVPGVESVGLTSHLPFDDSLPNWYSYYWPDGAPKQDQNTIMADHRSIFPGYFHAIGATFIAGRDVDDFDIKENREVVIIDETVAEQAWPNASALGKKLNIEHKVTTFNSERGAMEVVGVVKHIQSHSLTDPVRGQIYLPYPQAVRPHMSFAIKSIAPPQSLLPFLQREVSKLDKDLPIYNAQPMDAYVDKARRETRFTTTLAGTLALIALLLACTGVYGVTSYSVLQRTNELGTRIALGAQPKDIFGMVLREGMLPVSSGLILGLLLSFGLTPLMSGLLFGVRASDPATLIATSIFLAAVGFLACYLPARRAMRVDPLVALRYE
jgi:putative ABC transport system permease protein